METNTPDLKENFKTHEKALKHINMYNICDILNNIGTDLLVSVVFLLFLWETTTCVSLPCHIASTVMMMFNRRKLSMILTIRNNKIKIKRARVTLTSHSTFSSNVHCNINEKSNVKGMKAVNTGFPKFNAAIRHSCAYLHQRLGSGS